MKILIQQRIDLSRLHLILTLFPSGQSEKWTLLSFGSSVVAPLSGYRD